MIDDLLELVEKKPIIDDFIRFIGLSVAFILFFVGSLLIWNGL